MEPDADEKTTPAPARGAARPARPPAGLGRDPPTNALPRDKVLEIARVWRATRSAKATSRALKLSRVTVTKYLREGDPSRGIPPINPAFRSGTGEGGGEIPPDFARLEAETPSPPAPALAPAQGLTAAPPAVPSAPPKGARDGGEEEEDEGAEGEGLAPALGGAPPAAPSPQAQAAKAAKATTLAEVDQEMLVYLRLQRRLAQGRLQETANVVAHVKKGLPDPANPARRVPGRISAEQRELLALLGNAKASPLEVMALYREEKAILARLAPADLDESEDAASLDALADEVRSIVGETCNRAADE